MNRIERLINNKSSKSNSDVYSFDEVRAILGVSAPTMRRLIYSGSIRATKLGRRWYIAKSALEIALDFNTENSLNPYTTK